jgi:hypothetical protein
MQKSAKFAKALAIAASFSMMTVTACVNQPITQPSGTPSGTPGTPLPGIPSGNPGSPNPAQPGTVTPDISAPATVTGIVYDDLQQRVSDATVTARILSGRGAFANGSDTLTTTTQVGAYALMNVPSGATVLVTVSKDGFTRREQTIIPLANLQGNPDANRLDFGMRAGAADAATAMSNKPEVQAMTPAAEATGVDGATSFTLTFSEPMNKADVENAFVIAVATDTAGGYTLSNGVTLPQQYTPNTDLFGGAALAAGTNTIYGNTAFNFAWSNSDKTVTATFRSGQKLPSDRDAARVPQYAVGFSAALRDASGSGTRSDRFFRTSPAQLGKNGYRFALAPDTTAPRLIGVTALNNASGNGGNDQVRLQFSETMVLYPSNMAAIPNATATPERSALTLGNYEWTFQSDKPAAYGAGTAFGGSAGFWDGDLSRSTIVLNHNTNGAFNTGNVWAGVAGTVEDPAGNRIETQSSANLKNGFAI